ncbi:MAG: 1-phosphofructokinase [Candidatus Howiella sp.]|jgi:1-phosphofructokinase
MIYTVTFNPAIDYVLHMPALHPGEVNRAASEAVYYGGKGINVSCVLQTLGLLNTAIAFTAGFTGTALRDGLEASGVRTDFIELGTGLTRINVKIKADAETDINANGPDIGLDALNALYKKLGRLKAGDYLCLSGSIPPSLPDDVYEKILQSLSGKGIESIVDATGDLLVNVLKHHPFLIKPNGFELGEILGTELRTMDEIEAGARKLQERGARNVLVSLAGDGALLVTEAGVRHVLAAPEGKVKNSVGAGDSMVAGFLAGYIETGDLLYALRLGTAAGSATAFSDGLAQREEIDRLMQRTARD